MKYVRPTFQEWEGTEGEIDSAFQKVKCHMIYDVKMLDADGVFSWKARYVAGGHTTTPPASLTYASAMSQDSVHIALPLAALNGLDVLACDIQNAYLTAECCEIFFCIAGAEFGSEEG